MGDGYGNGGKEKEKEAARYTEREPRMKKREAEKPLNAFEKTKLHTIFTLSYVIIKPFNGHVP